MAQAVQANPTVETTHLLGAESIAPSTDGVQERVSSAAKEGIKRPGVGKPLSSENVSMDPIFGKLFSVLVGLFSLLTYQPLWDGVSGALDSLNQHLEPEHASEELKKPMQHAKRTVEHLSSHISRHAENLEKLSKVTTDDVVVKIAEKVQELGIDKKLARGFLNSVAGEAEKAAVGFLKKTCQIPKQFVTTGFQMAKSAALSFFGGGQEQQERVV